METQMTANVETLALLPQSLLKFEEFLHLDEPFSRREKLRHLDAEISLPLKHLALISAEFWAELMGSYGDALSFSVALEQDVLASDTMGTPTPAQFASPVKIYGPEALATLRLNIDKQVLARNLNLPKKSQSHRFFLYLFEDRLPYLLSRSLLDCERDLWGMSVDSQVVLLVCDQEVLLQGEYLLVCGGSHLADLSGYLRSENGGAESFSMEKMRSTRRANLNWEMQWVTGITPFHFQVSASQGTASSFLSRVCALQCARLFLLYSAEVTMKDEASVWSIYRHGQTPVRVRWPQLPRDAQAESPLALEANSQHLVALTRWIYEPTWPTDRLSMTQLYVSEELRFYASENCLSELLRQAARIESDLQSRWKNFIGKKLDGYSEQERKLEDDIGKAISTFDDQVSAIIKSLVESGMAAAVAVTASFLTAYFRTPFNPTAFTIGLCVYAGYVLIFPIGISLTHQWGRYHASIREFQSRRKRIEKRLDEKKVEEVLSESQFESNKVRLRRWLWGALGIYLVLMTVALAGAYILPRTLEAPVKTSLLKGAMNAKQVSSR